MLTPTSRDAFVPLTRSAPYTLLASVQALVTWANSGTVRTAILEASKFPLADDMPAFLLVNQLVYRGSARPSELADILQTDRSNVSKIVRRLEKANLISRAKSKTDGRSVEVALTADGRSVGERIVAASVSLFGGIEARWDPAELREFERLVYRFVSELDEQTGRGVTREAGNWKVEDGPYHDLDGESSGR